LPPRATTIVSRPVRQHDAGFAGLIFSKFNLSSTLYIVLLNVAAIFMRRYACH
jgi:hypothetical protein